MAVETITAKLWQEKMTDSILPIVVNFSAVRCGFCQALDPLYNRLSEQYKDKLVFLKLMVDDKNNQELIDRLSIEGTPTLKFYCKNREIGEHIGYAIEPILKQKIETFLSEMEFCIKNSTPLAKNIQDDTRCVHMSIEGTCWCFSFSKSFNMIFLTAVVLSAVSLTFSLFLKKRM